MNIWLVMLFGGLITFGIRFSLIYLFGRFDVSLTNTRLLAGVVAIVTAWFSRNTLLTILTGMAALFILELLGL